MTTAFGHPVQGPRCADRQLDGLGGAHMPDCEGAPLAPTAATDGVGMSGPSQPATTVRGSEPVEC